MTPWGEKEEDDIRTDETEKSPEVASPGERAKSQSVYVQQGGYEGGIASIIFDAMRRVTELEFYARIKGNTQSRIEIESWGRNIVLLIGGHLRFRNPESYGRYMAEWAKAQRTFSGRNLWNYALVLVGEMTSELGMFGRKKSGLSQDSGKGIELLLSGGQPPP